VYRGWTIGCAVQYTVYSVFYSVCWDTVLAQSFVVIRCALCMVHGAWCMVHGAWCMVRATVRLSCGGLQYGSYGVVHDGCSMLSCTEVLVLFMVVQGTGYISNCVRRVVLLTVLVLL
jgi:hypothetical protein